MEGREKFRTNEKAEVYRLIRAIFFGLRTSVAAFGALGFCGGRVLGLAKRRPRLSPVVASATEERASVLNRWGRVIDGVGSGRAGIRPLPGVDDSMCTDAERHIPAELFDNELESRRGIPGWLAVAARRCRATAPHAWD